MTNLVCLDFNVFREFIKIRTLVVKMLLKLRYNVNILGSNRNLYFLENFRKISLF